MDRFNLSNVTLAHVTDGHFGFLLGEHECSSGFSLSPSGIESPGMLRVLRRMVARLHQAGCHGHWLILDGSEVVGLCGYKHPPDASRHVEIGYGVAPDRRIKGYATKAISLVLHEARSDQAVDAVLAETSIDNLASKLVLLRNGFIHAGTREDAEDGMLDLWRFDL
ncbi:MAG: hypothetical protein B7Z78_03640 [Rhodospirillales bacterium 20-60-12]|nr:MAG: hypothetical protein B7Z78_03640 [Rhodospirillales bacterium 20-60-12]HQT68612.1 GNAT family N-acetyltransferase [Acetobacteraceae bacterium]HQU01785.1 GNAT family N-acetyltransferase [Acetobacteraceae bacterium]